MSEKSSKRAASGFSERLRKIFIKYEEALTYIFFGAYDARLLYSKIRLKNASWRNKRSCDDSDGNCADNRDNLCFYNK